MRQLKVIQMGLGTIGIELTKLLSSRRNLVIAGAVDVDPNKIGKDIGKVAHLKKPLGLTVKASLEEILKQTSVDILLHTASSSFITTSEQIRPAVEAGISVVSTCEEMAFPWHKHNVAAKKLDSLAKKHNATLVGTGVNPGFIMDLLPVTLTGPVSGINNISVTRIVDAGKRRLPLQRKVGAGLSVKEFKEKAADGSIRHVGMEESLSLIAYGLGWKLDDITEAIEPIISNKTIQTPYLTVQPKQVAGVHQIATGIRNGRVAIKLELYMYVGAEDSVDSTYIEASPNIDMKIHGGIFGDSATIAMVANTLYSMAEAPSGLLTVLDLPTIRLQEG